VDSRTSDVSIFMCSSGVRWILVMFDMMTRLLCWILICWIVMCMLHFLLLCMYCIFYMPFWRLLSQGGRQNRQKKIKKILMFIGYVHQLTDAHNLCSSVGRGT
jgi:hypothetical protein